MGIQEKEIMEMYREMLAERKGVNITLEGLATLTAARILKGTMENCCLKICDSLEQLREKINSFDFTLTLQQAMAVIDMDDIGFDEGLGPETKEACDGWGELLTQAEAITGRTVKANLTDAQITAQETVDEAHKLAYHKSQEEARREIANLMRPDEDVI